jgi:hypothetical protein
MRDRQVGYLRFARDAAWRPRSITTTPKRHLAAAVGKPSKCCRNY